MTIFSRVSVGSTSKFGARFLTTLFLLSKKYVQSGYPFTDAPDVQQHMGE